MSKLIQNIFMNEKELFTFLGFIKSSNHRLMALRAIEDSIKTPTEIGKETGIRTTKASDALISLKSKNLVVCLNEEAHKGRLYTATDLGKEILKEYDRRINSTGHDGQ